MSENILDIYKKRAEKEAAEAAAHQRAAAQAFEAERQQLLASIDSHFDRMFERLEAVKYADVGTPANIRLVRDASGVESEKVIWHASGVNERRYGQDDWKRDTVYVCSDRSFCIVVPKGAYSDNSDPVVVFQLDSLSLEDLKAVVTGMGYVGLRVRR